MMQLLRTAATPTWILLMVATILSWWMGTHDAHATITVMTISFAKCFLVGMVFMELMHAPQPLRIIFTVWCTIGWAGVLGIYLFM